MVSSAPCRDSGRPVHRLRDPTVPVARSAGPRREHCRAGTHHCLILGVVPARCAAHGPRGRPLGRTALHPGRYALLCLIPRRRRHGWFGSHAHGGECRVGTRSPLRVSGDSDADRPRCDHRAARTQVRDVHVGQRGSVSSSDLPRPAFSSAASWPPRPRVRCLTGAASMPCRPSSEPWAWPSH